MRRSLVVLMLALAASLAACGSSSPSSTTSTSSSSSSTVAHVTARHTVAGVGQLTSISCPTATLCEAVGSNALNGAGVVVTITKGSPGAPHVVSGTKALLSVSCATSTSCEAVGVGGGHGVVVPITQRYPRYPGGSPGRDDAADGLVLLGDRVRGRRSGHRQRRGLDRDSRAPGLRHHLGQCHRLPRHQLHQRGLDLQREVQRRARPRHRGDPRDVPGRSSRHIDLQRHRLYDRRQLRRGGARPARRQGEEHARSGDTQREQWEARPPRRGHRLRRVAPAGRGLSSWQQRLHRRRHERFCCVRRNGLTARGHPERRRRSPGVAAVRRRVSGCADWHRVPHGEHLRGGG